MYRTYRFPDNQIDRNLPAALADWQNARQQPLPRRIAVNPIHVGAVQNLTGLEVTANGGCLANEVWLEVE